MLSEIAFNVTQEGLLFCQKVYFLIECIFEFQLRTNVTPRMKIFNLNIQRWLCLIWNRVIFGAHIFYFKNVSKQKDQIQQIIVVALIFVHLNFAFKKNRSMKKKKRANCAFCCCLHELLVKFYFLSSRYWCENRCCRKVATDWLTCLYCFTLNWTSLIFSIGVKLPFIIS